MNKKLNILMVTDIYFQDMVGGSGRVVSETSKILAKRGHNIYVLTRRYNNLPIKETTDGIVVHRYNMDFYNPIKGSLESIINCRKGIENILSDQKIDLIHFHHSPSSIGAMLSRKIKQIPKLRTFHSPWHKEYEIKTKDIEKNPIKMTIRKVYIWIRWLIEKAILKNCDRIVVLSEFMKDQIQSYFSDSKEKITIIPGGIDTERFKPAEDKSDVRRRLNIPQDRHILLTVRNLLPRMGLENLIEAVKIIIDNNKNVLLIIVGKGFLENRLKDMVTRLKLDDYIKFAGFISDDELPMYYQIADIFILPTRFLEGFGLVTLEALSSGIPVLATPIGGTIEILKEFNKRLFFENSSARSMAKLINEYVQLGNKRLDELGKEGREYVLTKYSWNLVADKLEEFYYKIINR